jgi:hypothetical protein
LANAQRQGRNCATSSDAASAETEARAARELNADEAEYLPILADTLVRQKKFKGLIELIELGDRDPVLESTDRTAHGTAAAGLLAVRPAARGALGDAAAFELRRDAEHGKDKLGKIGLVSTTGSAIERKPAPERCMS